MIDPHYASVKYFYKDKRAKRSGQLYMRHIDQGLLVIDHTCPYYSKIRVMQAFCLHPIVQKDEDLKLLFEIGSLLNGDWNVQATLLAMEYRRVANSYLSRHPVRTMVDIGPLDEVKWMLVADKVQNYYDLLKFNEKHPRFEQLKAYFESWMLILGIEKKVGKLFRMLDEHEPV